MSETKYVGNQSFSAGENKGIIGRIIHFFVLLYFANTLYWHFLASLQIPYKDVGGLRTKPVSLGVLSSFPADSKFAPSLFRACIEKVQQMKYNHIRRHM